MYFRHPKKARAAGEADMRNPASRTAAFQRLRIAGKIPPELDPSDYPKWSGYIDAIRARAEVIGQLVDAEADKYLPPRRKKQQST